ncbi:hypothetical protein [Terriglobus sp. TAA 43]|uniref:hypothetical protein n=1 Tax=Terriglobus sp. TAA 43 TaxID=278961 RepID=UPI000645E985|nr:hypothetical protein [Terriglobus sp. TAA 43]
MRERSSGSLWRAGWPPTWVLLWLVLALGVEHRALAQVATTTVSDTVYQADGTPASGTVLVSWPAFTTASGQSVPKGSTSVTLSAGGVLTVSLAPNVSATPAGTYYTVVYHLNDGSTSREYWVVPVNSSPVKLTAVRNTVLPTSVAMQTVSRQYVDQAIARAALTGAVPEDASPYVQKTGDTMTGALVLPGDPTSGLQAATKSYVDATTTGLQAGMAQKVSLIPQATQTVTQPAGTQLRVNLLNGSVYAKSYQTQGASDGIANAFASSDCSTSCTVVADPSYSGTEPATVTRDGGRVIDQRLNNNDEYTLNARGGYGHSLNTTWTMGASARKVNGFNLANQFALSITANALAGGNNTFLQGSTVTPYFKTTYGAVSIQGRNNTQGQHVLESREQRCYGVGDCLMGSQYLYNSGGVRDDGDEGSHPYDVQISEDTSVFTGTCATGCTSGSTQLTTTATTGGGTQGDGRYLIDKAPSKTLSAGLIVGQGSNTVHSSVQFSGTSFALSTFFTTASAALSQSNNMAPGTVTLPIVTSGVSTGYSTNTANAPAGSGIACVVDPLGTASADGFEMAPYTVMDGSHIQLTLNKPKFAGATIAIGGLCGYGIEQTADTAGTIRQLFPVIGSITPTMLLYSSLATPNLGKQQGPSAFANITSTITSLQRSGNVVTATIASAFPADLNSLKLTIAGATDASFNGTFAITSTAANQFTYAQTGPNATSSGGTASYQNGGYVLYPMAEVLSVMNASTNTVDGTFVLAPNTVAWAAGDPVEQPHFFQLRENSDVSFVTQYMPRGMLEQHAGIQFDGVVGAGVTGWMVNNSANANQYYGSGGTHIPPQAALQVKGVWTDALDMQAGETSAIHVRCNSHGCANWNSTFSLLNLQSSAGADTVNYSPSTSTLTFSMRGTPYVISPTGLTAGTINATTLNVSRINGMQTATASDVGGVTLGPMASSSVLANVATSGSASDLTSGTLDPARLPANAGICASNVSYSANPTFAVTCANATFHMPLTGNVTNETFTGLTAGQRITLIFQVGSTPGYTVAWSSQVHGGFVTNGTSGAAGYTQAGKYLVQQLVVDTDGVTLLNPGAINE